MRCCASVCHAWVGLPETSSHLVPRASLISPEIPNEIRPRQGAGAEGVSPRAVAVQRPPSPMHHQHSPQGARGVGGAESVLEPSVQNKQPEMDMGGGDIGEKKRKRIRVNAK